MNARTVVVDEKPAAPVRVSIPESGGMGKILSQGKTIYSALVPDPPEFWVSR